MTTLNQYQHRASLTAIYPEAGDGSVLAVVYTALGVAGEAGEIANKAKKLLRDGDLPQLRHAIKEELGDVLWYVACLADELGWPLSRVAERNLEKLTDRAERGALHGSGDQR